MAIPRAMAKASPQRLALSRRADRFGLSRRVDHRLGLGRHLVPYRLERAVVSSNCRVVERLREIDEFGDLSPELQIMALILDERMGRVIDREQ